MSGEAEKTAQFAVAIETSGAVGSVAVGRLDATGAVTVVGVRQFTRPRAHAIEFFPAIEGLCHEHALSPSKLGHVYVSSGPGSFTGLRIGITAARSLAFATGAKVVSIPTLVVIAQNALLADQPPDHLAVVLDAKRGHVYAAAFRRCGVSNSGGDAYVSAGDPIEADPAVFLANQELSCAVMGEGVLYHRQAVRESRLRVIDEATYRPRAEVVMALGAAAAKEGRFVQPRQLIPTYIRPPEAEEKWAAKHGSASP